MRSWAFAQSPIIACFQIVVSAPLCLRIVVYDMTAFLLHCGGGICESAHEGTIIAFERFDASRTILMQLDGLIFGHPIDINATRRTITLCIELRNKVLVSGQPGTLASVRKRSCGATRGIILRRDLENVDHVTIKDPAVSINRKLKENRPTGMIKYTHFDVLATTR